MSERKGKDCHFCGEPCVATCDYVLMEPGAARPKVSVCCRPICQAHRHGSGRVRAASRWSGFDTIDYCTEHKGDRVG